VCSGSDALQLGLTPTYITLAWMTIFATLARELILERLVYTDTRRKVSLSGQM